MASIIELRKLYQLHIKLDDIQPSIWRRILIDSKISLPKFHLTLQTVMGWQDQHRHEFFQRGIRYGIPDEDFSHAKVAEHKFKLDELIKKPGDQLVYMYNFGDGWAHTITLEQVDSWDTACSSPLCVDGERACPPEDCGGPPGYEEILNTVKKQRRHKAFNGHLIEFEPEEFDLGFVNQDLAYFL